MKNKQKFCEELLVYFPLIRHESHRKRRVQQLFYCCGKIFIEPLPSNDRGMHKRTHRHKRPTYIQFLRVFIAVGTCLLSRCLGMKRGICSTEPLRSNERRDTYHLHEKCPWFLHDFNENWIMSIGFNKTTRYKLSRKSIQWEPCCSRLTEMMKLISASSR
jgi:hypothetical protein